MNKRRFVIGCTGFVLRCALPRSCVNKVVVPDGCVKSSLSLLATKSEVSAKETADVHAVAF